MSTATRPANTCRLTISIRGTDYRVKPLPCDRSIGARAYRLRKLDGSGTVYHVLQGRYGLDCDCPSHIWRHNGAPSTLCKHCKSLISVGLLDAPRPATVPAPRPATSRRAAPFA